MTPAVGAAPPAPPPAGPPRRAASDDGAPFARLMGESAGDAAPASATRRPASEADGESTDADVAEAAVGTAAERPKTTEGLGGAPAPAAKGDSAVPPRGRPEADAPAAAAAPAAAVPPPPAAEAPVRQEPAPRASVTQPSVGVGDGASTAARARPGAAGHAGDRAGIDAHASGPRPPADEGARAAPAPRTEAAAPASPQADGLRAAPSPTETLPRALREAVMRAMRGEGGTTPAGVASAPGVGAEASTPAAVPAAAPSPVGQAPQVSPPVAAQALPTTTAAPQQLAEAAARVMVEATTEGRWQASLRLDPPELGRLDIQLGRSEQGALSAHFVAATAGARAALEQAMPLLQQQLAGQGLQLGDASVSQQQTGGGASTGGQRDPAGHGAGGPDDGGEPPSVPITASALRARGLFEGWA